MKLSLFALFFVLGCLGPIGPKERIKSFYKDLASASDLESLESHFSSKKSLGDFDVPISPYKVGRLKFVAVTEKAPDKAFVTVDLKINKNKSEIEVRKIVELSKDGSDWKIDKIENVKTYIEIEKSIDIKYLFFLLTISEPKKVFT